MLIARMNIAASGVGLPEFDQGVWDRPTVFIEYAARHDDPFAHGLALVLAGEVGISGQDLLVSVHRTRHFRQRVRHENERLPWRAFQRRYIRRIEARRLGALFLATVRNRIGQSDLPIS